MNISPLLVPDDRSRNNFRNVLSWIKPQRVENFQINSWTILIKFYIKPLHKTFLLPSGVQHFINLISLFTLHVSAFIGHLQVFYLFWLKLLLVFMIFPHRVTSVFAFVVGCLILVPGAAVTFVLWFMCCSFFSGRPTLHSACGCCIIEVQQDA
jgi:hypothetical protein